MTPEKHVTINGHLIEQFYWNGSQVVYVDNHMYSRSFEDACDEARNDGTAACMVY